MRQIISRFKKLVLFTTTVACMAVTFAACNKTKEASTEEVSTVDSTAMSTETPMAITDSLPPVDSTAKTRPDGTNN